MYVYVRICRCSYLSQIKIYTYIFRPLLLLRTSIFEFIADILYSIVSIVRLTVHCLQLVCYYTVFSSLETRTWLDLCHKKSLLPLATLFYALGVVKSAFCLVFSLCMHVTMIRLALKCDLFHRNKATIPRISIIQLFQY